MGAIKIFPSDREWSKYIRTRDKWTCVRCEKKYIPPTSALHCSHFHSRGVWSLRFDEDNCEALCYGCHSYLGSNPTEHYEHKFNRLGKKRFDALQHKKNNPKSNIIAYYKSKEFRKTIKEKMEGLKNAEKTS